MGGRTAQLDYIVGPRRTSDTTTLRRGILGTIIQFARLYGKMKRRINSLKGGEGQMDRDGEHKMTDQELNSGRQ